MAFDMLRGRSTGWNMSNIKSRKRKVQSSTINPWVITKGSKGYIFFLLFRNSLEMFSTMLSLVRLGSEVDQWSGGICQDLSLASEIEIMNQVVVNTSTNILLGIQTPTAISMRPGMAFWTPFHANASLFEAYRQQFHFLGTWEVKDFQSSCTMCGSDSTTIRIHEERVFLNQGDLEENQEKRNDVHGVFFPKW